MTRSLTKSKDRIDQLGEVYTPASLVKEMLDQLPPEVWSDPTKTFIDPACGDGNFLVEVVARKISCGSTPTQALSTTYGIDIMEDNVSECRERLLAATGNPAGGDSIVARNIRCANSLQVSPDALWGE